MTRKYEEYTRQELETLAYCLPQHKYMWAARIMGTILGCDFRDSDKVYMSILEKNFFNNGFLKNAEDLPHD